MTHSHRTARLPQGASPFAYKVLDPRTLGRPVHLLDAFAAQLREDLAELFRTGLNRRYQADFQVTGLSIDAAGAGAPPGRWQGYATPAGRLACALDRILVLSALVYRYGLNGDGASPAAAPETATEERLATMLGRQLADLLAARIASGLDAGDGEPAAASATTPLGAVTAPRCACLIKATIHERTHRIEGHIYLAVDDAGLSQLLRSLATTQRRRPSPVASVPLAGRLNFKLVARLLQRDLPLGELLDLKVGDVIPVSLRAADVLIDDSRLMTATVAEHKGKLCLTSFEDVK
ncbi:MAG TPA: FliM/FliN family flagellar motor C-terminal domain-containing protein [Azonexus sp.]